MVFGLFPVGASALTEHEKVEIGELLDNSIVLTTKSPIAYVWGEREYVDPENYDVLPVIENGRTLVPVRFVAESLGAEITWNSDTQTVVIFSDDDFISITIGKDEMILNDETIALDVPAKIENGRTLVPLRAISEALDMNIFYHDGFILISADEIFLDVNDEDVVTIIDFLSYVMLVYTTGSGEDFTFMDKTVPRDGVLVLTDDNLPFETRDAVAVTGGLVIDHVSITKEDSENYRIKMDVHNTSSTMGIAEFYDKNGELIEYEMINKLKPVVSSIGETAEKALDVTFGFGWAIGETIMGNEHAFGYEYALNAEITTIDIVVPIGSYMFMTTNVKESELLFIYDFVNLAVEAVSLLTVWAPTTSAKDKDDLVLDITMQVFDVFKDDLKDGVLSGASLDKLLEKTLAIGDLDKLTANFLDVVTDLINGQEIDLLKYYKDQLNILGLGVASSSLEEALTKAGGLAGAGLEICFAMGDASNLTYFVLDMSKALETDPLLLVTDFEDVSPAFNDATQFVGHWEIDIDLTIAENGEAPGVTFGSMFKLGNGMTLDRTGGFSYGFSWLGTTGTFDLVDGVIEFNGTNYEEEDDKGEIFPEEIDGETYLYMPVLGGEYGVYWKKNTNNWKDAYIEYVEKHDSEMTITSFSYILTDLNLDNMPELFVNGFTPIQGDRLLTYTPNGLDAESILSASGLHFDSSKNTILLESANGGVFSHYIYKITYDGFEKISYGDWGATSLVDGYFWENEEVSQDVYEQKLAEYFDFDYATQIFPYTDMYTADEIIDEINKY